MNQLSIDNDVTIEPGIQARVWHFPTFMCIRLKVPKHADELPFKKGGRIAFTSDTKRYTGTIDEVEMYDWPSETSLTIWLDEIMNRSRPMMFEGVTAIFPALVMSWDMRRALMQQGDVFGGWYTTPGAPLLFKTTNEALAKEWLQTGNEDLIARMT